MASGSAAHPIAVYGAIAANAIIAVIKFIAAYITGSSAMVSEGIHSVVDTGNQLLLLLGIHKSKKPADEMHPFGHGKDLYFWGLVVAMLLFGIGGGMSIYEGISHLRHPSELSDPTWSYVVLALAFVIEAIVLVIAVRELLRQKPKGANWWQAMRASKDPAIYVVVAEDAAALAGVMVAAGGIFLGHWLNNPLWDGAASIVIGVILAVVAVFLAYESKGLLLGESADPVIVRAVKALAEGDAAVRAVQSPLTMHFGPHNVLLTMAVEFKPHLTGAELVAGVDRLQAGIKKKFPQVTRIFIEADSFTDGAKDVASDHKAITGDTAPA